MRISDWSSAVCSSDLVEAQLDLGADAVELPGRLRPRHRVALVRRDRVVVAPLVDAHLLRFELHHRVGALARVLAVQQLVDADRRGVAVRDRPRSEEHTSELQSLLRISYAAFCLNKKHSCYLEEQAYNKWR